jgi:peptidoglycan/LPS O-acetylase OafA/YrhL
MNLAAFSQGRDNNFNLIRIIAALAVLVTHSFALTTGKASAEPFQNQLGMTLGSIAVDIFFITSGFLVTASLLSRKSTTDFIISRALRIYPALLVMQLLTIFALGPYFTSLALPEFLTSKITLNYFLRDSTLLLGVVHELPGVFQNNPYKIVVNGSLWTMPSEVRLYIILIFFWFILRLFKEKRMIAFKSLVLACFFLSGVFIFIDHFYLHKNIYFIKLFFVFFTGASFYILRNFIYFSKILFWTLFCTLCVSAIDEIFFYVIYHLVLAYLLFYLAYMPSGIIRKYNKLGDYSYGLYIYAWPIQQSLVALIPEISIAAMIGLASFFTICMSVLSWHLLEKRVLDSKTRLLLSVRSIARPKIL